MRDVDKVCFLDPPISQAGLSRTSPSSSRQYRSRLKLLFFRRWRGQHCSLPWNRAGWKILCFCSTASGNHFFNKRALSLSSGLSGSWVDSERCAASSLSPTIPPIASGQEIAVWGRIASPRVSGQSLQGQREFCCDEPEHAAFWAIQHDSPLLHLCGYVDCPFGATRTEFRGMAWAAQPVPLAHSDSSSRLRDSVCQATAQVQQRPQDLWQSETPLFCAWILLSCWRRMQSSLSLQLRWSRGFTALTSLCQIKSGGLRPILDLWVLNRALHKLPFKMLTQMCILRCIQCQGWFAAVDLKDAFKSRFFLDTGRSYGLRSRVGHGSTRSSPSGCPCSPRVFMKIMEGALAPLSEVGIRNLNYRNDWLIMAQSRDQLCDHGDLVLWHLSQLGLRGANLCRQSLSSLWS